MKKRKFELEADLDPADSPRTRPGGTAARLAFEATKVGAKARAKGSAAKAPTKTRATGFAALEADLDPPGTRRTRPGGFAAARAGAPTKRARKKR